MRQGTTSPSSLERTKTSFAPFTPSPTTKVRCRGTSGRSIVKVLPGLGVGRKSCVSSWSDWAAAGLVRAASATSAAIPIVARRG